VLIDAFLSERRASARQDRTVVVGLGNDIAGDDGVGILAARRLKSVLIDHDDVRVVELPWAGLHLLDAIQGYDRAILIDCLCGGQHPPGSVVRLSEADFVGSVRLNSFHDLNYPTAMAFGRALGMSLPGQVEIYAVEGEVFDEFTTRLSPAVAGGLDEVVELVATRLGADATLKRNENVEVIHASNNVSGLATR
jgi:hydrogenase maturation protease